MKWTLPTVVNPPKTRCFVINIPDEPYHVAAFRGALLNLASATQWQDDLAHTARDVALVWREVLNNVTDCAGTPQPIKPHGREVDFDMSGLRVDCDCNVWITCCDGEEKQILTSQQVRDLINGQPGPGAPQPPPGGGEACYDGILRTGTSWLIPTALNTGDVITLSNVAGATNDGIVPGWYCGDGQLFFAGLCIGGVITDGGNRMPTAPNGSLVLYINGTYYDLSAGPFTLPGGIANQQGVLEINYAPGAVGSGELTFTACVQNNQTSSWISIMDFTLNPYSSVVAAPFAAWVIGQGYPGGVNGGVPNWAELDIASIDGTTITSMEMLYDDVANGGTSITIFFGVAAAIYGGVTGTPSTGTNLLYSVADVYTNGSPFGLVAVVGSGTTGSAVNIRRWTIRGTGTKPSQLP